MNAQIIEIILFAALAAFLVMRLKNVLGTRTGNEDPPKAMPPTWPSHEGRDAGEKTGTATSGAPRVEATPPAAEAESESIPLGDADRIALREIRQVEPSFQLSKFVQGAKQAYEWIILDYENGEKDRLRQMLSPETFSEFEKVIDDRKAKELTVEARLVGVRKAEIEAVRFDASTNKAEVAIRLVADMITAVRNAQGEIVEGDPRTIRQQTNHWVFERKVGTDDPNWVLVET